MTPELSFEGNHTELQQCMLNLCLNAIQAMPDGGHLRIEGGKTTLQAEFFLPEEIPAPGRYLRISVIDTGAGMDQEALEHLFEPFFTTKEDGTGLGLMSCKRIVASHGGVMRVESSLATAPDSPVHAAGGTGGGQRTRRSRDLHGSAERVLVTVEEAAQLSLLVDMLDTYGYQPHASQSGAAARCSGSRPAACPTW